MEKERDKEKEGRVNAEEELKQTKKMLEEVRKVLDDERRGREAADEPEMPEEGRRPDRDDDDDDSPDSSLLAEDVSKSRRGRGPRRIGDINENVVALIVAVPTVGISGVAWRRPVVTVVTNIGGRSDVGRWR